MGQPLRRSKTTEVKAVGPDHPRTLVLASNTMLVLAQLGRFGEADELIVRYAGTPLEESVRFASAGGALACQWQREESDARIELDESDRRRR